MLQQETRETETSAAHIRVTPQELVQATAAIEARQDQRAQQEASTIPLGDAVQQLGLQTTPEELLAEVEKQRQQTQQTAPKQKSHSPRIAVTLLGAIIVAQMAAMGALWFQLGDARTHIASLQRQIQPRVVAAAPTTATTAKATTSADPMLVQQFSKDFRTLDIGEGQTVACKFDTIQTLARGKSPSQLWTAKVPQGTTWNLTRKNGKFYVQCWTNAKWAELVINGHEGIVSAAKNIDTEEKPDRPITLPLEQFVGATEHYTKDSVASVVLNANRP